MAEKSVLKIDSDGAASIDAYLEYRRIVGDDDHGIMFTPEEYEMYKKEVMPIRLKNRLFVSWSAPSMMDCKLIGPETPCFCTHRYKQHKTDFKVIPERPIKMPCRASKCKCASYHYVPMNGSQPIRCSCKHTSEEHSEVEPYVCRLKSCSKCSGFKSSFTCGCGSPTYAHEMIVETAVERKARGHPIGQATPYAAMGGLTGFSSLAEGYLRLDPSGVGAPSEEFLSQPITAADHPFLRANVQSVKAYQTTTGQNDRMLVDATEMMNSMKLPGESDMNFYERRYQERQRALKSEHRGNVKGSLQTGKRMVKPKK